MIKAKSSLLIWEESIWESRSWLGGLLAFSPATEPRWEGGSQGCAGVRHTGQACLQRKPWGGVSRGRVWKRGAGAEPLWKPWPGDLVFEPTGSYGPNEMFLGGLGWRAQRGGKRSGCPGCIPVRRKGKHAAKDKPALAQSAVCMGCPTSAECGRGLQGLGLVPTDTLIHLPLMGPAPSLLKRGLRGRTSCLSHGSVIKINDADLRAPHGRLCATVNFSAYHSPWCFPYRPVSFPETQQRADSYTVYRVLGVRGCAVSSAPWGTI